MTQSYHLPRSAVAAAIGGSQKLAAAVLEDACRDLRPREWERGDREIAKAEALLTVLRDGREGHRQKNGRWNGRGGHGDRQLAINQTVLGLSHLRQRAKNIHWLLDPARAASWCEAAGLDYDALISRLRARQLLPPAPEKPRWWPQSRVTA